MKYIFILLPLGLFIYLFYLYDQYWPNDVYLKEYEKISEMKGHLGNRMVDGAPEPEMPDFYNNNTTLYGIDKNKNGVRDDVEIWINLNARSKLEKEMYVNYARSVFYYTERDVVKKSKDELLIVLRQKYLNKTKANDCFFITCESVNLKNNSSFNCIEQSSNLVRVIENNKFRSFNFENISDDVDYSTSSETFGKCRSELKEKIEKDILYK